MIPLSFIFFFKSGSFAWNGIFGFYLPFVTFWIWFVVMTYTVRRALPPRLVVPIPLTLPNGLAWRPRPVRDGSIIASDQLR